MGHPGEARRLVASKGGGLVSGAVRAPSGAAPVQAETHASDKTLHVLVLGEADSGKSAFINIAVNNLRGGSLDVSGLKAATPTSHFPAAQPADGAATSADVSNPLQCTQYDVTYRGHSVAFIDTPALGGNCSDEAAAAQDNTAARAQNDAAASALIVQQVAALPSIAAIVLVIDGGKARLDEAARTAFAVLRQSMPHVVATNMLFVFTKCNERQRTFDTCNLAIDLLMPHAAADPDTCFHLQNSAFVGGLNALKVRGADFASMMNSWKDTLETLGRLMRKIVSMVPQKTAAESGYPEEAGNTVANQATLTTDAAAGFPSRIVGPDALGSHPDRGTDAFASPVRPNCSLPCFQYMTTGSCSNGASCELSHVPGPYLQHPTWHQPTWSGYGQPIGPATSAHFPPLSATWNQQVPRQPSAHPSYRPQFGSSGQEWPSIGQLARPQILDSAFPPLQAAETAPSRPRTARQPPQDDMENVFEDAFHADCEPWRAKAALLRLRATGETSEKQVQVLLPTSGPNPGHLALNPRPNPVVKSVPGRPVSIKANSAHSGRFLTAWSNGKVVGSQKWTTPREWEIFELIFLTDHLVAFKTWNGKYLSASPEGNLSMENHIDERSVFTLACHGEDYAVRSSCGLYLCVDKRLQVVINRRRAGPWEKFTIE